MGSIRTTDSDRSHWKKQVRSWTGSRDTTDLQPNTTILRAVYLSADDAKDAREGAQSIEGRACARHIGDVLAFITDEDVLQARHSLPKTDVPPFISTPSPHATSAREEGRVSIHFRPRTCCTHAIHFPTGVPPFISPVAPRAEHTTLPRPCVLYPCEGARR